MPADPLIPLDRLDPAAAVADIEAIREVNPHRFEMEQLTRICHYEPDAGLVAGVQDVAEDAWWGRGHIPGRPVMPGVMMIEAAAQLCSWFVRTAYGQWLNADKFFGFGGLDRVKFRGIVFPGQTLLILGRATDLRPRRAVFATQGFVESKMVFEAEITGLWI